MITLFQWRQSHWANKIFPDIKELQAPPTIVHFYELPMGLSLVAPRYEKTNVTWTNHLFTRSHYMQYQEIHIDDSLGWKLLNYATSELSLIRVLKFQRFMQLISAISDYLACLDIAMSVAIPQLIFYLYILNWDLDFRNLGKKFLEHFVPMNIIWCNKK